MTNPRITPRRRAVVGLSIVAMLMLAFGGVEFAAPAAKAPASTAGNTSAFLEEQQELRSEFRARTRAQAIFERTGQSAIGPIEHAPTPGWQGEQRFGAGNDWEPDIAADPSSDYVYMATTRFGSLLCANCARPSIIYRVSDDGGHTWGPEKYLCKGCDNWQYDPTIDVADDGTVFMSWLSNGWSTWVVSSTDNGQTWSPRVDAKGDIAWSDHGFVTVSPDGQDVYVAFSGNKEWLGYKGNNFVAASHDGGATFADPVRTNPNDDLYYYDYSGTVLSDDTVVIAVATVSNIPYARRLQRYLVVRSTDGGLSWEQIWVDTGKRQPFCYTTGCRKDHWAGLSSVDSDAADNLMYVYTVARAVGKGQLTYVMTSTDGGQTWLGPTRLSKTKVGSRRVIAAFPDVVGVGAGDFRVVWMDNRNGRFRWNVYHRQTLDGGMTWDAAADISDATSGAPYKHPAGFDGDYGDYLGIDANMAGQTVAAWGEAFSYWGPGGTWTNVQV